MPFGIKNIDAQIVFPLENFFNKMETKSFLDDYPKLKKEWNYEKNNELGFYPEKLSKGSHKKVWWICEAKGHEWDAAIAHRTNNRNCPYCINKKICEDSSNSLYFTASDRLKQEWNEEKNGSMKLYTPGSKKKVWWICEEQKHEWQAVISNRLYNNCPYCVNRRIYQDSSNSLYFTASDKLKQEWNEEKNGNMTMYTPSSSKKVWWKCIEKGHEWEATVYSRKDKNNCPYCSNKKICKNGSNSLFYTASNRLKKEWVIKKNGSMKKYAPGSNQKVWWKCIEKGHEWESRISHRIKNVNCPYCANQKIDENNSLYFTASDKLKQEWNEEKNGSMKLYTPGSTKRVWWKCIEKGHEWETILNSRSKRTIKCPYCTNRKLCEDGSNSLYSTASDRLKQEWNEEKNGSMKEYTPSSGKKVWWICVEKKHEWQAVIGSRKTHNCPICCMSKLEREFEENVKKLKLNFCSQTRYKDTKKYLYDYTVYLSTKEIRIELQGEQHFQTDMYFYNKLKLPIQEYIKRLNIDTIKSSSAYQAKHSFLSFSYLCANNLSMILPQYLLDLENYDILLRYYITPYIYIQYAETNGIGISDTEICYELSDEENIIYRIYLHNIESLQNPIELSEENFTECCNQLYFDDSIHLHQLLEHTEYSEEEYSPCS